LHAVGRGETKPTFGGFGAFFAPPGPYPDNKLGPFQGTSNQRHEKILKNMYPQPKTFFRRILNTGKTYIHIVKINFSNIFKKNLRIIRKINRRMKGQLSLFDAFNNRHPLICLFDYSIFSREDIFYLA
jgi:hypothetical protein